MHSQLRTCWIKIKPRTQVLKECILRYDLIKANASRKISPLAQTAKQNKPRRSVFYYQSEPHQTYSAAQASIKFKLRFAGELQTKPVRQILSICAIKFDFHPAKASHAKPR